MDQVSIRTEALSGDQVAVRTFLIADVRGYTRFTVEHGDEAAAGLAARFADIVRDTVPAYAGEVIEVRGDEALAVFSSARQALRAAVALMDAFSRHTQSEPGMPLKVGIGLDAGEAVPLEGGYRGAALNLAARLCSLAGPGEILTSDGVIHLARKTDRLAYLERGAVDLKGFDEPVRVVEVRPASEADRADGEDIAVDTPTARELPIGGYLGSLPANRVVGREMEMDRIAQVVETVMNETGRLLVLVGEPGVGKTRLAQEVTLHLRGRDCLIAAGRCYEPQQAVPFYPFIEALTHLYIGSPVELRREVPTRWPELARLLPALGLPVADGAGLPDQQRLFWAVTGFVAAVARETPVAMLLDDLHWADATSLELLQHLARHTDCDRVFLLGTYRDVEVNRQHPLEAALRDLGREGLLERLEVRRLGREETRQLIEAVMGQDEAISDELTDLLYRRTEGNAFFVQQVLHALVERGDVLRKDGRWDRKAIEELSVPESVRSVVGQRLSRLSEDTQEVLREASVLGQTFTFDDLQAMSDRAEHEVEQCLDEAIGAGMLRESSRDGYGFDHALTQSALSAELSSRRRRRLHLAAGEAIESLPARKREGRAAELAWHFLEGGDEERALRWSIAAGDGAEGVFAHSDAEYHYRTALQLAREIDDAAREFEAREKLGGALAGMGRYGEAVEVYEPVVRWYREQGNVEGEVRLMAEVGWLLFHQNRRDEGIERLRPVLERWERQPLVSVAAASLHVALGNLYWHAGWMEDALRLLDRAGDLATTVGDDRLLGTAESRRGVVLYQLRRADEELQAYTRSIPLLESAGDLEMLGKTLNNRAYVYGDRGQPDRAWDDLERALAIARRVGDPVGIGWALGILAQTKWSAAGDGSEARAYAEELLRLERYVRGTRASEYLSLAYWLRLVVGRDMSGLQDITRLAEEGERAGDVNLWQFAQYWLAEWDVVQGRPREALSRHDAVLTHPAIESQSRPIFERSLAYLCVVSGEIERAEALIPPRPEQAAQLSWISPWPTWLAVRARLRAAQGKWEQARADIEETLESARERSLALGIGEAAHVYGGILAQRGEIESARERFTEALSVFRRMSAQPYIERTERALAELG